MDNIFKIDGGLISLSEQQSDPSKKIAKFLLCPLDEPNLNGKGIKESDLTEDEMKTLMGQPLVTKLIYNEKTKQYDFSGHLMKRIYKIDNDGKLIKFSDFTSTNPIGYHTNIEIEELEIEGVNKRCLVATVTLWTRYYHAMEVIERLGNSLHTSWELSYSQSYEENGTTWLKGILFLANCVLGSNINPAYKIAGLLECAEEDVDNELAEAMLQDINTLNKIQNQTDNNSVDDKLNNIEGGHEIMAEENKKQEISSLTSSDLRSKVTRAIYATEGNGRYYYGVIILPLEFRAIAKLEGQDTKEFDYTEFTYVVNSDETISITSQQDVEMVFVPKADNENMVSELETKLKEVNTSLSEKVEEIIKLGDTIKTQETTIAEKESLIEELTPFKEQIAEINAEKEKLEIAEKQKALKQMAISSKYITEEDIETSEELKNAISELNEKYVKEIIAEKVIAQATQNKKQDNKVEVSEQTKEVEVSTDLNASQEYNYSKSGNVLLDFINKKNKRKY